MKKIIGLLMGTVMSLMLAAASFAGEADVTSVYGFPGEYNEEQADSTCLTVSEDTLLIEDAMMNCHQETAIQTSEDAVMILNRSYVTDSVLPMVTTDTGKSFFINSTVNSTSGGAVFGGLAIPPEEDGSPLSLYMYGSRINAMSNSNGVYAELLCDAYIYGSYISGVQAGIESNTFGSITVGTLKDGQDNEKLKAVLAELDNEEAADSETGSIIESNGNAIIVSSTNDPDFRELDGLSESTLAEMSAQISIRNAQLKTIKKASRSARWQQEDTEYQKHSKGSVILVKSTNADITVENSVLEAYEKGTGCILQTVPGDDDPEYLMTVSDGETAPGICASFREMELNGNIVHEDYQRDLNIEMASVTWTGAANEYNAAHWNSIAEEEGFDDLCIDDEYEMHHGICIALAQTSVWNVTEESHISKLVIEEGCTVNGIITVDGSEVPVQEAEYEGEIVISPVQ